MFWIWLALIVIFLVIEASTINMVTLWFAIGAIGALLMLLWHFSLLWQIVVFVVLSALGLGVFLWFFKPRLSRGRKVIPTNADRIIGATGRVTKAIDPHTGSGQIEVLGQSWSALPAENEAIPLDCEVVVTEIRGVRAVCRRK